MKVLIDGQTLSTPEMQRGIGLVFLRLLEEMVVPEISIQWCVAVKEEGALAKLPEQVAQSVEPVLVPAFHAEGAQVDWCRAYGTEIQKIVDRVRPDWYWNPNPLMPNVHFPFGLRGVRTAWTLHDLIPLAFPAWYLDRWPASLAEDYLARLEAMSQHADVLLPVSRASGLDLMRRYPATRARMHTVHWASDYSLMYPLRAGVANQGGRYILYVGGFDPRKNMDGAVRAFARFRAALDRGERETVRFKIVCADSGPEAANLGVLASSLGIGEAVELTGYVSDEELGKLFRSAAVFFFPSLSEGFGLPVLDALACGIPVVAGANSSIPEVVGEHAFLADAGDVGDLAVKLRSAWDARRERPGPWRENARYARANFNWAASADHYLSIFRGDAEPVAKAPATRAAASSTAIAYFSPWPPQHTGVADYSYSVVRHLARRHPVVVFTEAVDPVPLEGVEVRPLHEFLADPTRYPRRIYHLGNNLTHREIYRTAWDHPGVVVVHDYNIHPFLIHAFLLSGDAETYKKALLDYGEAGAEAWRSFEVDGIMPPTWGFPMIEPIIARSRGAIVHSRWVARQLRAARGVWANHLGVESVSPIDDAERAAARAELGLAQESLYVGAFGFVNAHKRIDVVARAVGALRARGYPVVLVVVGEVNDVRVDLDQLRAEHGLDDGGMIHVGYVSEEGYERHLSAIDVLVSLRYPTMGESSASLFRGLGRAVPSIVSDVGQFAELPHDAAWKVEAGGDEVEILDRYLAHLLEHPDSRRALGAGGQRFIERFAGMERTAQTYLRSCEDA